MASCRDCPCDSASCRESRQEAKSHGQSLQEAIYQGQPSRQEARDHGQTVSAEAKYDGSLCRKRKLADSFIPFTTCNYNLRLQDSSIHQGILELGIRQSDSSGTRVSCDFEIDAGPGKHVMFYFVHAQLTPEGQQYDVSCIEIKDNVGNIQTTVEDFPMKACFSTDVQFEDQVYATTGSKLSIRFYRNRGYSMAAGFRLVFTAFREDSCRTSERKCDNGRCIAHDIVCKNYNPCGDHSDCPTGLEHLSTLALAGIIVVALLGGGTVIIIAAVCLQQGGRKRLGRHASEWSTTYQSNGDVLEMQTEVVSDDVLAPQPSRTANRNQLYSVAEDRHSASPVKPLYSELQRQETRETNVPNNPDEYIPGAGDPLNGSSPQESVTSANLSSCPITTDTHLPEAFNSQEQIGSEIFDSEINNQEAEKRNSSVSTTAILHVDYDNPALLASSNDLSTDDNKVLLSDKHSHTKIPDTCFKPKVSKRPPPDYKIVMKNSGRFHVHDSGR